MRRTLYLLFFFTVLSSASNSLHAYSRSPSCLETLQVSFFNPYIVSKAMSLYFQDQSQWAIINRNLQLRSLEVPGIMHERAKRMVPNPLNAPFQAEAAEQMLLEILYEIFSGVLYERNLKVNFDVREMFQFIYRQQQDRFDACFGPYRSQFREPPRQ